MFKVCRHSVNISQKSCIRLKQKTALAQCTVLATAASMVTVPPLYQVNGKTVHPENHR